MTATIPSAQPALTAEGSAADQAPFSQILREATQRAHQAAEASPFVHRLMAGELDRAAFARLTVQLHPVYEALEGSTVSDPVRDRFDDPRLHRLSALERDLAALVGPDWRTAAPVLPQARAYADHVASIAHSTPAFVGHHYTRYLGDLSGGQAIARRVARNYGLREGEPGLLFYSFAEIPKPKPYKDRYRHALDTAPWSAAERAEVVAEAEHAFAMNAAVFAALV